jgi:hypothetical protein
VQHIANPEHTVSVTSSKLLLLLLESYTVALQAATLVGASTCSIGLHHFNVVLPGGLLVMAVLASPALPTG